jgi:hypothetical protein
VANFFCLGSKIGERKAGRNPKDKGVNGDQPKEQAYPGEYLKVTFQNEVPPISEGFHINFLNE